MCCGLCLCALVVTLGSVALHQITDHTSC